MQLDPWQERIIEQILDGRRVLICGRLPGKKTMLEELTRRWRESCAEPLPATITTVAAENEPS